MPLSAEAQHVIDSFEAHANAVVAAARGGSDRLLSDARDFADRAIAAVEQFGVRFRDHAKLVSHATGETNNQHPVLGSDGSPQYAYRGYKTAQADANIGGVPVHGFAPDSAPGSAYERDPHGDAQAKPAAFNTVIPPTKNQPPA